MVLRHIRQTSRPAGNKRVLMLIFVVALMAAILSVVVAYFYSVRSIEELQTIPMDLKVQNKTSFNLDQDALHFGGVFPGGSSERGIVIVNKRDFSLKARFYMSGELGNWVLPEDNPVFLQPFENRTIKFTATAPKDAAYGNYTGELTVVFKKA